MQFILCHVAASLILIEHSSVTDPKLIISDLDPLIGIQEFRIWILDPDPSVTLDGEKKL